MRVFYEILWIVFFYDRRARCDTLLCPAGLAISVFASVFSPVLVKIGHAAVLLDVDGYQAQRVLVDLWDFEEGG